MNAQTGVESFVSRARREALVGIAGKIILALLPLSALTAGIVPCGGVHEAVAGTAEDRVSTRVASLADPALEGRASGSAGIATARKLVLAWMEEAGLEPAGSDGSWFQTFRAGDLPAGVSPRTEGVHLPEGSGWDSVEFTNIVSILPGTESAGATGAAGGAVRESVVFGAHLDHLGVGPDHAVFTGADDNASGVVALIEAARQLKADGPYGRDIVFVVFDGEESGELGSRYYVAHPTRPIAGIEAMINLDTVGRMDGRGLLALGSGTALELEETLRGINLGYGFDLGLPEKGPFASDQVPFFEAGVPVVHFTTGPNLDYHRVGDTADKIATTELTELSEFVAELVAHLADKEERLSFVPPGAAQAEKMAPAAGSAPRRVSLGTIPDFARESGGVLLSGVIPESPAEKAGLRKGDVLVEMDGTPVDNLGDFSGILKSHQPGDEVSVVVLRGEEKIQAVVTLVERK